MYAKVILAIAILLTSLTYYSMAQGQTLVVHGRSYHSVGEHNNANYGLGYRFDSGYVVGAYHNSDGRASVYAGYDWRYNEYASVSVALATGYKYAVMPIVMPTLSVPLWTGGPRFAVGVAPIKSGGDLGILVHSMLHVNF